MRKVMLVLASLALIGTACGSDDKADTSTGDDSPVALEGEVNEGELGEVSGGEIEIELDDLYFGPSFTKADAGSTVKVELKNEGDAKHTFTIDALDIDKEVAAGDAVEVEVTLPASGAVRYYCRFHAASGMQGAFYAKSGDTITTGSGGGSGGTTSTTAASGSTVSTIDDGY